MHLLRKVLRYSSSATVRFSSLSRVFVKFADSVKISLFSSWDLADADHGRNWIPWHSLCETLTWATSTASFSVELIISINPAEVDVWLFSADTRAPQVSQPLFCGYQVRCLWASCALWWHSLCISNWASLTKALLSFLFVKSISTNRACKIRLES